MRTLEQWFEEYGETHQTKFNKQVHFICVPSIFFSTIGLLSCVPLSFMQPFLPDLLAPLAHLGSVLIVGGLIFYLRLSLPIALGMFILSVLFLLGNSVIANLNIAPLWAISLGIFATAWVGQFIGHKHEGKKPSFLTDLAFLMIGPAWILGFIYRKIGIQY